MIVKPDRPRLEQLARDVVEGRLTLRLEGSFSLEQASEAHRRLARGKVRGKLVLLAGG